MEARYLRELVCGLESLSRGRYEGSGRELSWQGDEGKEIMVKHFLEVHALCRVDNQALPDEILCVERDAKGC